MLIKKWSPFFPLLKSLYHLLFVRYQKYWENNRTRYLWLHKPCDRYTRVIGLFSAGKRKHTLLLWVEKRSWALWINIFLSPSFGIPLCVRRKLICSQSSIKVPDLFWGDILNSGSVSKPFNEIWVMPSIIASTMSQIN